MEMVISARNNVLYIVNGHVPFSYLNKMRLYIRLVVGNSNLSGSKLLRPQITGWIESLLIVVCTQIFQKILSKNLDLLP
jgi:hypothetical protein